MSDQNPYGNTPPEPGTPPTAPGYDAPPQGYPGAAGYPSAPEYPTAPPAYGTTAPAYGAPGYPAPAYGGAYGARKTNVLAILALIGGITGIIAILPFLGSLAGIILGHISLNQIKKTGEQGRGLALAGLITGYVGLALIVLFLILLFALFIPFAISEGVYRS